MFLVLVNVRLWIRKSHVDELKSNESNVCVLCRKWICSFHSLIFTKNTMDINNYLQATTNKIYESVEISILKI